MLRLALRLIDYNQVCFFGFCLLSFRILFLFIQPKNNLEGPVSSVSRDCFSNPWRFDTQTGFMLTVFTVSECLIRFTEVGGLAQMVERPLCMREVPGSIFSFGSLIDSKHFPVSYLHFGGELSKRHSNSMSSQTVLLSTIITRPTILYRV